jgi:hypothetical protein
MHYVMLQKLGNIMESQISVEITKYCPVHIWNKYSKILRRQFRETVTLSYNQLNKIVIPLLVCYGSHP